MKEKYVAEIIQYLNEQDEIHVKGLAELSHFMSNNRLTYIIEFVNKLFGSH